MRAPGGIEVLAEEDDWAVDDGYRLAQLGPHDADVAAMWDQLRNGRETRSRCGTWSAIRVATDGSFAATRWRAGWSGGMTDQATTWWSMVAASLGGVRRHAGALRGRDVPPVHPRHRKG